MASMKSLVTAAAVLLALTHAQEGPVATALDDVYEFVADVEADLDGAGSLEGSMEASGEDDGSSVEFAASDEGDEDGRSRIFGGRFPEDSAEGDEAEGSLEGR